MSEAIKKGRGRPLGSTQRKPRKTEETPRPARTGATLSMKAHFYRYGKKGAIFYSNSGDNAATGYANAYGRTITTRRVGVFGWNHNELMGGSSVINAMTEITLTNDAPATYIPKKKGVSS